MVTVVGRRQSGAMNYIAVIRRLASTCTPAHTLNCTCTRLRTSRARENGRKSRGPALNHQAAVLMKPISHLCHPSLLQTPSHHPPATPCEATARPLTDSLLSSSRHLVASLSVILSPLLSAAFISLEAAGPPVRPTLIVRLYPSFLPSFLTAGIDVSIIATNFQS